MSILKLIAISSILEYIYITIKYLKYDYLFQIRKSVLRIKGVAIILHTFLNVISVWDVGATDIRIWLTILALFPTLHSIVG